MCQIIPVPSIAIWQYYMARPDLMSLMARDSWNVECQWMGQRWGGIPWHWELEYVVPVCTRVCMYMYVTAWRLGDSVSTGRSQQ